MSASSDWLETNREMWDERVPIHVDGEFYDVAGFLAGRSALRSFEPGELGDVSGCTLLHSQCHFGLDTLSWARLGARVTGLDFSGPAVAAARELAQRAGIDAEFVQANVLDAVAALGGRRFDVVYTGLGAIIWLPDIEAWARTMASLLAPGGRLYLVEFHPVTDMFADESLDLTRSYFDRRELVYDEPGTYADLTAKTVHNRSIEWSHGLGEVVSAVIAAGLELELLHEFDYTLFPRWPLLERAGDGTYRMPEGTPEIPLMYSLRARGGGAPQG